MAVFVHDAWMVGWASSRDIIFTYSPHTLDHEVGSPYCDREKLLCDRRSSTQQSHLGRLLYVHVIAIRGSHIQLFFLDMIWKFSFARECIQLIQDASSITSPPYSFILEVDAKLRSHVFPTAFRMPNQGSDDYTMAMPGDSPALITVRTTAFIVRELG
jgi:hypothetical protein